MRYLVFTDIHGNLEALLAVLKAVLKKRIDHYLFLGDLVGYGASPNEVVQKLAALKPLSLVRGNHDKAVCGLDSVQTFNPIAASAIFWTKSRITKKNFDFLYRIKKSPDDRPRDDHHLPRRAVRRGLLHLRGIRRGRGLLLFPDARSAFFGHTHFPFVYAEKEQIVEGTFLEGRSNEVKLEKGVRYLINPGSVGQPRDRNPMAAYAIYDSGARTVKFYRVEYDVAEAQRKILEQNLPSALAERLTLGI